MRKWTSKYTIANSAEYAPTKARKFYAMGVKRDPLLGTGLHTHESIKQGAIVAIDGGQIVSSTEDTPPEKNFGALIAENLYLIPLDYENPDELTFINHSCEPTLMRIGGLVMVAKRDIQAGEALTLDYGPLMANAPEDWKLDCQCQAPSCRKTITKFDWQNPAIAERLWNEWLPETQKLILKQGIL